MLTQPNSREGVVPGTRVSFDASFYLYPASCNMLQMMYAGRDGGIYNFDRTASSLYLTSFNALLFGFQLSNCFSNSKVSAVSSVLTKSSSSRPLIIQGRWYGLGWVRPSCFRTWHSTCFTSVVSRACNMARLYAKLEMCSWQVGKDQGSTKVGQGGRRGHTHKPGHRRKAWNDLHHHTDSLLKVRIARG